MTSIEAGTASDGTIYVFLDCLEIWFRNISAQGDDKTSNACNMALTALAGLKSLNAKVARGSPDCHADFETAGDIERLGGKSETRTGTLVLASNRIEAISDICVKERAKMSSLIIEVCEIQEVAPHANADKMDVIRVKGWSCCSGKGQFKVGDKCLYIPPDSVLPTVLSDKWGVTKYLTPLAKNEDGTRPDGGRVRVARLRGFPSYGFVMPLEDSIYPVGHDLADYYGITKYDPPLDCTDGDAAKPHPAFHRYTDIENYRNFPEIFQDGERVEISEKLHGKCTRLALIRVADETGATTAQFMAGSHEVNRKEYSILMKKRVNRETGEEEKYEVKRQSQFWEAMDTAGVKDLLTALSTQGLNNLDADVRPDLEPVNNVVLFGEIYGSGVQDLAYGYKNGEWAFRAFDVSVNGRYLGYDAKHRLFQKYEVPEVPVLYVGPFSRDLIEKYVSGSTTLGGGNIREGIVITTAEERPAVTEKKVFDRAILKVVSFEYLERKGGSEFH